MENPFALEINPDYLTATELIGKIGAEHLHFIDEIKLDKEVLEDNQIKIPKIFLKTFHDLLKKQHPKTINKKDIILIVPDRFIFSEQFEMSNNLSTADLENKLIVKASTVFPFNIDDVVYFQKNKKLQTTHTIVDYYVIPKFYLKPYQDFFAKHGYKIKALVPMSFALLNAIEVKGDSLIFFETIEDISITYLRNNYIQDSIYIRKDFKFQNFLKEELKILIDEKFSDYYKNMAGAKLNVIYHHPTLLEDHKKHFNIYTENIAKLAEEVGVEKIISQFIEEGAEVKVEDKKIQLKSKLLTGFGAAKYGLSSKELNKIFILK